MSVRRTLAVATGNLDPVVASDDGQPLLLAHPQSAAAAAFRDLSREVGGALAL